MKFRGQRSLSLFFQKGFSSLLVLLLLSPYVLALVQAPKGDLNLEGRWMWPLWMGARQAALSAVLALVVGGILFLSLRACSSYKSFRWVRSLLLWPNLIPPLFVILSVMSLSQWLGWSHQGLMWVILTHALMNGGLVALAVFAHDQNQVQKLSEVARVYGASVPRRFFDIWLPQMKSVLIPNFVLVFAICLTSFSIPLVLGGGSLTSLEVHIFQLIRTEGAWSLALFYSVIQTLFVLVLSLTLWKLKGEDTFSESYIPPSRPLPAVFLGVSILPILVLSGFWFLSVAKDFTILFYDPAFFDFLQSKDFLESVIHSSLIFILVFWIQTFLSMGVIWGGRTGFTEGFLKGYVSPSVAVLGFSLSLLPGEGELWAVLKTSLCFSFLTFPLLFKWKNLSRWKGLSHQVTVAKVMGAGGGTRFWDVLWPQMREGIFQTSLIAALWSLGDFAVSSFFFSGSKTVALMVVDLLNKYRLEWASLISFALFAVGLLLFFVFQKGLESVRR